MNCKTAKVSFFGLLLNQRAPLDRLVACMANCCNETHHIKGDVAWSLRRLCLSLMEMRQVVLIDCNSPSWKAGHDMPFTRKWLIYVDWQARPRMLSQMTEIIAVIALLLGTFRY